jgi:hypothetical protein
MTKKPLATPLLTPEERLTLSRSEIANFMQNNNQILDILKPVVASYAKSDPIKTLGIAAGVGAAVVVFKPWRLISIGGLLAVLKSRL